MTYFLFGIVVFTFFYQIFIILKRWYNYCKWKKSVTCTSVQSGNFVDNSTWDKNPGGCKYFVIKKGHDITISSPECGNEK